MIFLGFIWLILLVIELTTGLSPVLESLSLTIWGIFIMDFLLKLLIAPQKRAYIRKNWLTALALLLPALRFLQVFRYVRLLSSIRGVRLVKIVSSANRGMRSLAATMARRGFGYVVILSTIVIALGAAGMFGFEKGNSGFENYGMALWWTAMRVITAGSDYWPATTEGRVLAFFIALYGFAVFGCVTATLASFFVGRDAEKGSNTPASSGGNINELKAKIDSLERTIADLANTQGNRRE